MGKIVKTYKCIKTKDILKHIISVIPEVIDKYLNYVEENDTACAFCPCNFSSRATFSSPASMHMC